MKNLMSIVEREDIHAYVEKLWRTDIFRDSHRTGGFVHRLVDQFAWVPRVFAEETNDRLERAHFSTWWNVIMIRDDYTNPYIHDLYYLHEMAHAATMAYVPDIGRAAFDDKMQRNELEASVLSEIQVYFELPELREKSFPHEIYADRFLNQKSIQALWQGNRQVCIETIRAMRKDVMVSKPDYLMDHTEKWIRKFADQNAAYSVVWATAYNEIEQFMSLFQSDSIALDRAATARRHFDWITAKAALDPVDNIPFRLEAELFTPFYWANKARYDAAMNEQ